MALILGVNVLEIQSSHTRSWRFALVIWLESRSYILPYALRASVLPSAHRVNTIHAVTQRQEECVDVVNERVVVKSLAGTEVRTRTAGGSAKCSAYPVAALHLLRRSLRHSRAYMCLTDLY